MGMNKRSNIYKISEEKIKAKVYLTETKLKLKSYPTQPSLARKEDITPSRPVLHLRELHDLIFWVLILS
jgi:hypothetical protein